MTEFLQTFMSHDAGPVAQFLKYAIGGGCATVVDMMVFLSDVLEGPSGDERKRSYCSTSAAEGGCSG